MKTRVDIKKFVLYTVRIYFLFILVYAFVLFVVSLIPFGHSDDDPGFAMAVGFMIGFYISLFNTLFVVFLYRHCRVHIVYHTAWYYSPHH